MKPTKKNIPPFAKKLRAWRKAQKLTRQSAAFLLGISWRTVEMWERGRPAQPALERMARRMMQNGPSPATAQEKLPK